MIKQKAHLLLENLDQLKNLNIVFVPDVVLGWYLFQLNVLLKPDFNCFNSFTIVSIVLVDKVTTGTLSFVSVTINFGSWPAAVPATKHQFLYQVNIRLISELCNDISSVLRKLLKYFNGTINSIYFFWHFFLFVLSFFSLNLNEILLLLSAGKSTILLLSPKAGSSP